MLPKGSPSSIPAVWGRGESVRVGGEGRWGGRLMMRWGGQRRGKTQASRRRVNMPCLLTHVRAQARTGCVCGGMERGKGRGRTHTTPSNTPLSDALASDKRRGEATTTSKPRAPPGQGRHANAMPLCLCLWLKASLLFVCVGLALVPFCSSSFFPSARTKEADDVHLLPSLAHWCALLLLPSFLCNKATFAQNRHIFIHDPGPE